MSQAFSHDAVLLEEAVAALDIVADGFYIDGTFGRGGHSERILEQLDKEGGQLLAFDKDPEAVAWARERFGNDPRFAITQRSFADLAEVCREQGMTGKVDGVLLDLGVSSPQLDAPERGFSFLRDGPLDMRMDPDRGQSAADWLARAEADEIAGVLKTYGEERYAKRLARAIVEARQKSPLTRTTRLAQVIADAHPAWEKHKHPATRSFQAIRIFINQELTDLETALDAMLEVLKPGGRMVIIAFHSLEDRIVKRFISRQARGDDFPADLPVTVDQLNRKLKKVGKFQKAGSKELESNIRARSAVMRVAEKL